MPEVMSGRRERGTSGWMAKWEEVDICLRAVSRLKSMCLRDSKAVTGLSLDSLVAVSIEKKSVSKVVLETPPILKKVIL